MFPDVHKKADLSPWPAVSIVVAAHNEEKNIVNRLHNLVAQDYPEDKLEIIVVSDGSQDQTNRLVEEFIQEHSKSPEYEDSIILLHYDESQGKPSALNLGVGKAKGDIIVFADARQKFSEDAVQELVKNFSDPAVGCVSGELLFLKDRESKVQGEMGLYWRYEKMIRRKESDTGSVVGATGAIYAVRKNLFKDLPKSTLLDDVLTPLNIIHQGYRVVFDSQARAYDVVSKDTTQEWRRKIRTLAGNWQLFSLQPMLANPLCNSIWFRFFSHKIYRLLVPFAFPVVLVTGFLVNNIVANTISWGCILILLLATTAHFFQTFRNNSLVNFVYFFIVLNCAAVYGFWQWITGKCDKIWQPTYRQGE